MITSSFSNLKFALISLTIIFLLGCESTASFLKRPKSTHSIGSTDVFVTIPQEEIVLEEFRKLPIPNPPIELLLPIVVVALVIHALSGNEVEDEIQGLRDSLVEFEVNPLFLESLNGKLSAIKWLNVKNFTHNLDTEKKLRENSYANAVADTVLFINIRYAINKDFSAVIAYADISLFPKSEVLKQYAKDIYPWQIRSNTKFIRKSLFRDNVVRKEILSGTIRGKRKLNETHLSNNGEIAKQSLIALAKLMTDDIVSSIQKNGITFSD